MKKNKVLAGVLAAALALSTVVVPENHSIGEFTVGATSVEAAEYGTEYLTGYNLDLYNALRPEIAKIASGEESSTVVTVSLNYTYDELGVSNIQDAADLVFGEIDLGTVLYYMLYDCPYEFYWFDKTKDTTGDAGGSDNGTSCTLSMTFYFNVTADCQGENEYEVDADKAATATSAIANAQAIVDKYENESDADKLTAYKDEICALVDYEENYTSTTTYGDIWQMIWVFDDDDTTNVVCEGYAKAFQYLCDISEFESEVECYTVTGTTTNGLGAGSHMWNIVRIDGDSYMVDVTNSESGSIGENGELFMVCANDADAASASGYTFTTGGQTVTYTYDETVLALYSADVLTLVTEEETGGETGSEVIMGDVDGNGKPTYEDAMLILQYDVKSVDLDEDQLTAGDVTGDGKVDSQDAMMILSYDAGIITEF